MDAVRKNKSRKNIIKKILLLRVMSQVFRGQKIKNMLKAIKIYSEKDFLHSHKTFF